MDKIRDLMLKAGCKPELVDQIVESLNTYKSTLQEQFEADFTAKVEQAKKVCIEETEAHKRELSRRLQVFLETKSAAIDAHLQRQSALNESAAVSKLRNLKSLLEGVQVEQNAAALNGQVTPAVVENAKRKIQQLTEERNQAVAVANKKNSIAEKVLKHNRELTTENARLKSQLNGARQPVAEGRGAPRGAQRIDGSRQATRPTTSRPTIVENQERRPAAQNQQGQTRPAASKGGFGVVDIAGSMDEDLI